MNPPASSLEAALGDGRFVVTAEMPTLDTTDPAAALAAARHLGFADALSCTDNAAARPHLSAIATAAILSAHGFEAIAQFTCRDRNRIGAQSDLMGAHALGIRNILAMSGDFVSAGDEPEAKPVYDLDSTHLLRMIRIMTDLGTYLSGRATSGPPSFFVGAVENPFAPPYDFRPARMLKKIEAGARFFFTQCVFNIDRFRSFMSQVVNLGVAEHAYVIPSIAIPRSVKGAMFMKEKIAGIEIPDDVIRRLQDRPADEQAEEGVRIAAETVEAVRQMPGVSGVHLMPLHSEWSAARVAEEAGLLVPRANAADAAGRN